MQDVKALLDQFLGQPKDAQEPKAGSGQNQGAPNLQSLLGGAGGLATGALAGGLAELCWAARNRASWRNQRSKSAASPS